MTRRVVKLNYAGRVQYRHKQWHVEDEDAIMGCPYGSIRDRLWVRETWGFDNKEYIELYKKEIWRGEPDRRTADVFYKASEEDINIFPIGYWRPSIFMPRWASRINLEITDIRVERLHDITEEDAKVEGAKATIWGVNEIDWSGLLGFPDQRTSYKNGFSILWDSINGKKYPWSSNPWVWVIEFNQIK